jgi:hypothetical protein
VPLLDDKNNYHDSLAVAKPATAKIRLNGIVPSSCTSVLDWTREQLDSPALVLGCRLCDLILQCGFVGDDGVIDSSISEILVAFFFKLKNSDRYSVF